MGHKKNINAVALGTLGGKKKSKAKTRASRENGKKGGKPKKSVQEGDLKGEVNSNKTNAR